MQRIEWIFTGILACLLAIFALVYFRTNIKPIAPVNRTITNEIFQKERVIIQREAQTSVERIKFTELVNQNKSLSDKISKLEKLLPRDPDSTIASRLIFAQRDMITNQATTIKKASEVILLQDSTINDLHGINELRDVVILEQIKKIETIENDNIKQRKKVKRNRIIATVATVIGGGALFVLTK
jgi:hypothetical protein